MDDSRHNRLKGEGFLGQRLVVLPREIVRTYLENPLLQGVGGWVVSDAGYFPKATGHAVERHHGTSELILMYCVGGKGWVELQSEGDRRDVSEGSAIVLPAGVAHRYGVHQGVEPWSLYWLHLAGREVTRMGNLLPRVIEVGMAKELLDGFEGVLSAVEGGYGPDRMLRASGKASALLAELWVAMRRSQIGRKARGSKPGQRGEQSASERVEETVKYLEANLTARITVRELAAKANVSPQHYSELFKRHTGFSPIDYFLRLRLRQAMTLLGTTDSPIKRIAQSCGFACQLYFSRQFRKIYGAAPTSFRAGPHHRGR